MQYGSLVGRYLRRHPTRSAETQAHLTIEFTEPFYSRRIGNCKSMANPAPSISDPDGVCRTVLFQEQTLGLSVRNSTLFLTNHPIIDHSHFVLSAIR